MSAIAARAHEERLMQTGGHLFAEAFGGAQWNGQTRVEVATFVLAAL
jgi:hypothetical protein